MLCGICHLALEEHRLGSSQRSLVGGVRLFLLKSSVTRGQSSPIPRVSAPTASMAEQPSSPCCSCWCSEHPRSRLRSQLRSSSSRVEKILLGLSFFTMGYVELMEVAGSGESSDFTGLGI